MKILAACEDTGMVKEVSCIRGTDTSKKDGIQPKSIKDICNEEGTSAKTRVLQIEISGDYLVASRLGGTLCVYDTTKEEYDLLHTYTFEGVLKDDRPVSLVEDLHSEVIVVAYQSGKIFLVSFNDGKFDLKPIELHTPNTKEIACLAIHPVEVGVFAVGGRENDATVFKLYDSDIPATVFENKDEREQFFESKVLYTAKNVKNNHLDLRIPIWITKIEFLESEAGYKFITVTRYGQLRFYDTTHGKRPIKDYPIVDKPIIALNFTSAEQESIIVTDTHSLVAKFSLSEVDQRAFKTNSASAGTIIKPVAKLLGKYSGGNTGAVYDLDVVDDLVASGGLDRYIRVYDLESREVAAKVYIGAQINSVIILETEDDEDEVEAAAIAAGEPPKKKRPLEQEEDDEEDEEELWKQLGEEEVEKVSAKKQKK